MEVFHLAARRLLWALPALLVMAILVTEFVVYLSYITPIGEQNGLVAGLSAVPFVAVLLTSFLLLIKVVGSRYLCAWRAAWR
jgi:hypothetical protein